MSCEVIWLGGLDSSQRPRRAGMNKVQIQISGAWSGETFAGGCRFCWEIDWEVAKVSWEAWTQTSARGKRAGIKSRSRVRSVHGGRSSCEGASLAGELAGRP